MPLEAKSGNPVSFKPPKDREGGAKRQGVIVDEVSATVRASRPSVGLSGLAMRDALEREWANGIGVVETEGTAGAARFAAGAGRHGDFGSI
jgi:hypothetical protein